MAAQDYELYLRVQADMKAAVDALKEVNQGLSSLGQKAAAAGTTGSAGLGKVSDAASRAERTTASFGQRIQSVNVDLGKMAALLAGAFAVDRIVDAGRRVVETTIKYQQAMYTMEAATGSVKAAGDELDYVRGISQKLGLEYLSTAQAYSRLVAAAKNSEPLRGAIHGIFEGVADATTTLHLSADETQRILLAVEQMMSKGRVQTQELVLQLGQSIPGAFELAAQALHTNTAQLTQWLEKGQIATDQFLPRFAAALQEAYGGTAQSAAQGLNAQINRLHNAFTNLYLEAGNANVGTFTASVEELTQLLNDPSTHEGFNTLITGLSTATRWAVQAATGIANVTKFMGEEIARRQGYFSLDDTVGMETSLDRLLAKRKELQAQLSDWRPDFFKGGLREQQAQNDADIAQLEKLLALSKRLKDQGAAAAPKSLPDLVVTADRPAFQPTAGTRAAGGADTTARDAARAQQDLITTLQELQGQLDPVAAAWVTYNQTVAKADELAATAKKAHGANVEAIDAERKAIVQLAAQQRDAALDKLSKKDQEAWEKLRDSLRTPAEVRLDKAAEQIRQLNALMERGAHIGADEYQAALTRIGQASVGKLPTYHGVDASVGGVSSELAKNFRAQTDLETAYAQESAALRDKFDNDDLAQHQAYLAAKAQLDKDYADQSRIIEQSRQQLILQASADFFGNLATLQGSSNAKMARVGKAAAIAQAIIRTYMTANEAMAAMSGIPIIGPALGAAAAAAAIVAGLANVAQIRAQPVGGYAEGGYTGPGGKYQPAGIVHAGEVVFSQHDVARHGGVAAVEALRLGLRAYADGGIVNPLSGVPAPTLPAAPRMPLLAANDDAGRGGTNLTLHNHNYIDIDDLRERILSGPKAETHVVNHVLRNGRTVKQGIG